MMFPPFSSSLFELRKLICENLSPSHWPESEGLGLDNEAANSIDEGGQANYTSKGEHQCTDQMIMLIPNVG